MEEEASLSLEYTPTWIVAGVSAVIVLISLCAARALHRLGKWLKHKEQDALFESLEKLKEELMLLGFISLLLTVFQGIISRVCMPSSFATHMLPCKRSNSEMNGNEHIIHQTLNMGRQLLSSESNLQHCNKGKVPMMSIEALHQLHIFIFVLALVHVVFCLVTMILGGAKIRLWKSWEKSIKGKKTGTSGSASLSTHHEETHLHHEIFKQRAAGFWGKSSVGSWTISFFKQFYNSVTKSDYIALRHGFIMAHCPALEDFDFHEYMMRTLEVDFKKVVTISWYLWLFIILFLLWNVTGWHTYFWLSFLPLVLLLLIGAKLEHIITCLAQEIANGKRDGHERVKPSDEHFWFRRPKIVLHLIQFILFQNSFEIAFFLWILSTYGFHSCMMERFGYIITRLIMGVVVQVLCSYSTLPLYALVTQMGTSFKQGMFDEHVHGYLKGWVDEIKVKPRRKDLPGEIEIQMDKMVTEPRQHFGTLEHREDISDAVIDVNEISWAV